MNEEHGSPPAEPGVGRRLQRAREKDGLSLRRVEEATKIRARYLEGLERGNFGVLPPVYVLGSLKTYADFLGLDGTALARELRDKLEPDEAEAPVAADPGGGTAPVVSIGFDHLFVGMGVVIVSVLAFMTLVSTVARYEEPKVSQMNEPSVQDAPLEMALTGNKDPEPPGPERRASGETAEGSEEVEPDRGDGPAPPKKAESGGEDERTEETSLFGDVKFVPPPSSPSGEVSSASANTGAPAGASASSTTSAPASPSPASSASSSAASDPPPSAEAGRPEDAYASPTPANVRPAPQTRASAGAGSGPVVGPTRGDGTSRGSGSVISPRDVADSGRISAGVDTTLEGAIPGR